MNFIISMIIGGITVLAGQAFLTWVLGRITSDVDFDEIIADEINSKYNADSI